MFKSRLTLFFGCRRCFFKKHVIFEDEVINFAAYAFPITLILLKNIGIRILILNGVKCISLLLTLFLYIFKRYRLRFSLWINYKLRINIHHTLRWIDLLFNIDRIIEIGLKTHIIIICVYFSIIKRTILRT